MTEHPNVLELDLPEIRDRNPYIRPCSHLVKAGVDRWEEVAGRRESKTLLVNRIRPTVDAWREAGYPGASETTRRLFQFWFEEDHLLPSGEPFRYYFCQREAIETLVFLYEIEQRRDAADLVQAYFDSPDLLELEILTSTRGARSFRRYVPELGKSAEQELPPAGLTRYAVKMATGTGKTVVMALAIAWSLLHRRLETDSPMADNFLVVAPNVIVYERLREDFDAARIFHELPIAPPEWQSQFALQVIVRGDARR